MQGQIRCIYRQMAATNSYPAKSGRLLSHSNSPSPNEAGGDFNRCHCKAIPWSRTSESEQPDNPPDTYRVLRKRHRGKPSVELDKLPIVKWKLDRILALALKLHYSVSVFHPQVVAPRMLLRLA